MNRNMRMLHKENNRLDKTLCEDYQRLMTDIVCYLRGADISELQQEKVRYDLTLMLLEAQQRNAPLDEVFPEDYKAFCDTVIKELPPRSQLEKLRERLQIVFLLIAILGVINLFLSKDGLHALLQLDIQSTYPLSLSTLLLDILLGISAVCIVQWICRSSFENDDKVAAPVAVYIMHQCWLYAAVSEYHRAANSGMAVCTVLLQLLSAVSGSCVLQL